MNTVTNLKALACFWNNLSFSISSDSFLRSSPSNFGSTGSFDCGHTRINTSFHNNESAEMHLNILKTTYSCNILILKKCWVFPLKSQHIRTALQGSDSSFLIRAVSVSSGAWWKRPPVLWARRFRNSLPDLFKNIKMINRFYKSPSYTHYDIYIQSSIYFDSPL